MNETTTTTEVRPHPFANPQKAFEALMATGAALRKHANIKVKDDAAEDGKLVSRVTWFGAVKQAMGARIFTNEQHRKLKALRDELRRTKVSA
jgi:hypothetical protein